MTTTGEKAPCEGDRAGEAFRKRSFQQNSSGISELSTQQGGSYASISATIGISELEQILKHKTFTRSEIQRLIAVLSSRITKESPSDIAVIERDGASTTNGSLKKRKHRDESENFHASFVSSRVVEEEIASPAEVANAYKDSIVGTGQSLKEDLKLINNNATCASKTSVVSPQHPATMENFPDELLSNIFIRLLAKQLAQMRSVSKSWNALLSQSSFIRSHLNRSIHNDNQVLLVFHECEEAISEFKPFAAFPCRSPHLELTNFIKLPVNPGRPQDTKGIEVIGAVNGLICSCYGDSVIQIWNPSLSAVLTLPPYSTPSHAYGSINTLFRFGFDPKTYDYKVIKLTCLIGPPPIHGIKWWLQIEIYSMRKGTWELITERFPSDITHIVGVDYVCADGHNGHLHWLAKKMDLKVILAFDLGSETFCEIPLPHSTLDHNLLNELAVLSGKLCVMPQFGNEACEVWVMEEYGLAESWVKRHVITHFIGDTYPLGFTSLGQFLIEDNMNLVLYDPTVNKQKVLKDYGDEEYSAIKFVEYVDSLVWVAPAEHEMVDGGGQN